MALPTLATVLQLGGRFPAPRALPSLHGVQSPRWQDGGPQCPHKRQHPPARRTHWDGPAAAGLNSGSGTGMAVSFAAAAGTPLPAQQLLCGSVRACHLPCGSQRPIRCRFCLLSWHSCPSRNPTSHRRPARGRCPALPAMQPAQASSRTSQQPRWLGTGRPPPCPGQRAEERGFSRCGSFSISSLVCCSEIENQSMPPSRKTKTPASRCTHWPPRPQKSGLICAEGVSKDSPQAPPLHLLPRSTWLRLSHPTLPAPLSPAPSLGVQSSGLGRGGPASPRRRPSPPPLPRPPLLQRGPGAPVPASQVHRASVGVRVRARPSTDPGPPVAALWCYDQTLLGQPGASQEQPRGGKSRPRLFSPCGLRAPSPPPETRGGGPGPGVRASIHGPRGQVCPPGDRAGIQRPNSCSHRANGPVPSSPLSTYVSSLNSAEVLEYGGG